MGKLILECLKFKIPITPMPTPRPRLGRGGVVYNPKSYSDYKKSLISFINVLNIEKADYDYIHARFYLPYPKTTSQKKRIEDFPLKTNFDCDNVIKGLCDALEQSKVIENDRCLYSMFVEKFRTTEKVGRIEFDLEIIDQEDEQ